MNSPVKENYPRIRDNDDPNPPPPPQDQFYQYYTGYPPQKSNPKAKNKTIALKLVIISILLVPVGLYLVCLGPFDSIESVYFTFDSEAELNETLLNQLYLNLDADSRVNVTNETYFLVLSIPELDYSIRFDYLFEFTIDNLTDLRIKQHSKVLKITDFEARYDYNPYNLSIDFRINSTDPDILNVMIFPPDNIIDGELYLVGIDYMTFTVQLDEGEVIHGDRRHERMILPYNQIIILIVDHGHPCPFY